MNTQTNISSKSSILIIGIVLICGNLFAQRPQHPQGPPPLPDSTKIEQMVDKMATDLSLTSEQKAQIRELHFSHFNKVRAKMEKDRAEHEKKHDQMHALRTEFEEQVKDLLSDEQKIEFEKFMKDRGPRPGQQKPKR
jgi:Spy/CpxP family protein refolding chaperone